MLFYCHGLSFERRELAMTIRLTCSSQNCQNTILPATAERTDGLCMPCFNSKDDPLPPVKRPPEPGETSSYLLIYDKAESMEGDRLGGLPSHLPYVWPRCHSCHEKMAFLGQFYQSEALDLHGHFCLQFYACEEDCDLDNNVFLYTIRTTNKSKSYRVID